MNRVFVAAIGVCGALALSVGSAQAKPKPKPAAGTQITQNDVRICMGVDGSTPDDQIPACTKIINSGKVKAPHTGDFYATRAAAYFAKNQLDKAMADLNKAITIRQAPEFYFQRGMVNMSMRNLDAAKSDLGQVMKLKPEFSPPYLMRGLISYNLAEYAEALTFFDGALQRNPTYYQALFARGVTKKKLGQDSAGEKDIADARGMSNKVDDIMKGMGVRP